MRPTDGVELSRDVMAGHDGGEFSRNKLRPGVMGPAFAGATMDRYTSSYRHFAVQHRAAGGQAFRRIDDRIRINTVGPVELIDAAGLAEMVDAERFDPVAADAAEPAERGGM